MKSRLIFVLVVILGLMVGCNQKNKTENLKEAIEKAHKQDANILYQNKKDKLVIFEMKNKDSKELKKELIKITNSI